MKKSFLIVGMALCLLSSCSQKQEESTATATQAEAEALPTVKISKVNLRDVPQTAEFTANVEADATNNIAPQSPTRIKRINAEVGDHVRKGQTLVVLDDNNLVQLKAQLDNQTTEFNRTKELYVIGGVSKSQYDAAKMQLDILQRSYNNLLENTSLVSPINGVITARNYDNGDLYSGAMPVLVVEQIQPVKIMINVNEQYFNTVKKGMNIDKVTLDAIPGEVFTGRVSLKYPTLDAATRTFPVEVQLPNRDEKVRPGMFARVTLDFGSEQHIVVPDNAVIKQNGSGDRFVYILNADNTVSYTKIELGRRIGAEYEVLSGINDGASVVTFGQNKLADGVKVQVLQ